MKKILIACVGLLLMVSYGCSSEEAKESAEKTKEADQAGTAFPRGSLVDK